MQETLTIGKLAKRVGLRTSALRFYESEGLLLPAGRTQAGYRLYPPDSVQRIQTIQRARRLGFSLSDIRPLLNAWDSGDLSDQAIIQIAEQRYLQLEQQVTERLVLQHELELFLRDLHRRAQRNDRADSAFDNLLDRVCANPEAKASSNFMVEWLMHQASCNLASESGQDILQRLRGQHIHLWQENQAYHILFVTGDPSVGLALQALADLESGCQAHADTTPDFVSGDEGFLFIARGENAFIFARLFMALEHE